MTYASCEYTSNRDVTNPEDRQLAGRGFGDHYFHTLDTDLRLSPCLRFGGFLHFCHAHRFLRLIPKYPDCVIQPWSIPYARR
jgi:hypothetical protein